MIKMAAIANLSIEMMSTNDYKQGNLNNSRNDDDDDDSNDETFVAAISIAKESTRKSTNFRPTLGDEYQIGYFGQDHSTQTNRTDLAPVKALSQITKRLLKESSEMKRELNFIHCSIQADFELKLKEKSVELYVRMNERLTALEKMHSEKINTIRAAYRQQLCDAIAQIHSYYNSDFKKKMKKEELKESSDIGDKVKRLRALLDSKDEQIRLLMDQLAECESQNQQPDVTEDPDRDRKDPCAGLREQIEGLRKKISILEEKLSLQDESKRDLMKEIERLNRNLTTAQKKIDKLTKANSDLKLSASSAHLVVPVDDEDARNKNLLIESQAASMKRMLDEKKALEELLARERANCDSLRKKLADLEQSRGNELELSAEVDRLKKELERANRIWKKRFEILQESMRTLRDEFHLRQKLERKAALLHTASVSYAYDAPCDVPPKTYPAFSARSRSPLKKGPKNNPLPGIGNCQSGGDFIAYQVNPPTERKNYVFTSNADQNCSDEEEFRSDVVVLPSPPPGVFKNSAK